MIFNYYSNCPVLGAGHQNHHRSLVSALLQLAHILVGQTLVLLLQVLLLLYMIIIYLNDLKEGELIHL